MEEEEVIMVEVLAVVSAAVVVDSADLAEDFPVAVSGEVSVVVDSADSVAVCLVVGEHRGDSE